MRHSKWITPKLNSLLPVITQRCPITTSDPEIVRLMEKILYENYESPTKRGKRLGIGKYFVSWTPHARHSHAHSRPSWNLDREIMRTPWGCCLLCLSWTYRRSMSNIRTSKVPRALWLSCVEFVNECIKGHGTEHYNNYPFTTVTHTHKLCPAINKIGYFFPKFDPSQQLKNVLHDELWVVKYGRSSIILLILLSVVCPRRPHCWSIN